MKLPNQLDLQILFGDIFEECRCKTEDEVEDVKEWIYDALVTAGEDFIMYLEVQDE